MTHVPWQTKLVIHRHEQVTRRRTPERGQVVPFGQDRARAGSGVGSVRGEEHASETRVERKAMEITTEGCQLRARIRGPKRS